MPKGKKGFQPGNMHGALPKSTRPVSKTPICVKPFEDQMRKLKAVPDLPKRLRTFFDKLISGQTESSD